MHAWLVIYFLFISEICSSEIDSLEKFGLINVTTHSSNDTNDDTISSTIFGRLMARHYLSFETTKGLEKVHS